MDSGSAAEPQALITGGPRRWWIAGLFSVLFCALLYWVLQAGALPLVPPAEVRHQISPWTPALYAVLVLACILARDGRWYWLVRPVARVPLREILIVNALFFGANMLLPLRMGEFIRPVLFDRGGKVPGWQAMGMSGAERIVDGFISSLMLLAALALSTPLDPLPQSVGDLPVPTALIAPVATSAALLFTTALLVTCLFYRYRESARGFTLACLRPLSPELGTWLADKLEAVSDGLRFLPRLRYAAPFFAVSLLYWLGSAAGLVFLFRGCGMTAVTYPEGVVVLGVTSLGLMVPNTPGYFGAFQLGAYAGLALFVAPELISSAGAAGVFWMYTTQMVLTLVAFLVALVFYSRSRRREPA